MKSLPTTAHSDYLRNSLERSVNQTMANTYDTIDPVSVAERPARDHQANAYVHEHQGTTVGMALAEVNFLSRLLSAR